MKDRPLTREALKELFLEYFRPLTVYAIQYVKDLEVSEDIVQDVFLYLYEKRESFQFHDQGINYLYNLEHRRIRTERNPEVQHSLNSNPDDPLEMIIQIESESRYLQAVEVLSPKCKKVFEMSRMEGKSNQQIAD